MKTRICKNSNDKYKVQWHRDDWGWVDLINTRYSYLVDPPYPVTGLRTVCFDSKISNVVFDSFEQADVFRRQFISVFIEPDDFKEIKGFNTDMEDIVW